jgi:hypothetical protein
MENENQIKSIFDKVVSEKKSAEIEIEIVSTEVRPLEETLNIEEIEKDILEEFEEEESDELIKEEEEKKPEIIETKPTIEVSEKKSIFECIKKILRL